MTAIDSSGLGSGALKPVLEDDGLAVCIRPFNGRLRRAQADGIATLSAAHGNGLLDLTERGYVQIRGVTETSYPILIEGLRRMALVDADATVERRRNVIVTPLWQTGGETEKLAPLLTDALSQPDAPTISPPLMFAVDTGRAPVLQGDAADIRVERDAGGGLIVVADGADRGKPVAIETFADEALKLAEWFRKHRDNHRRMSDLLSDGVQLPADHLVPRQHQDYVPRLGATPLGAIIGITAGRFTNKTLASLAKQGGLRLTPWRMLLVEGARAVPQVDGILTEASGPT